MPKHHKSLGLCLRVPLEKSYTSGSTIRLRIIYSTTSGSAGIQWFDPSQTAGKKHPFCYTQCEAILARTVLPCQDTPAVKAPYDIRVSVPSPLVVACSGVPVGNNPTIEDDGRLSYSYKQTNPIPAYLIAVVAGALVKGAIGPRSSVWCEKEMLKSAVYEFESDTEKFIQTGESITGINYEWGVYDVVVLPAAFPYGGMENPNLTFLSASLLAGDRSLTNVVAHEITHSWAGNYTTNSSWSDFWLNEGFTVYIERIILGKLHGAAYRDFESLIGYNDLLKTVGDFGAGHEHTKLQPNLEDTDPDEAFSKIPYEKGSLFLRYLEHKVGGLDVMLRWLKEYFKTYRFKSLYTEDMKKHFLNHMEKVEKVSENALKSIEWDAFLKAPGMPPFDPTTIYDKSLTEKCTVLARKWIDQTGEGCTSSDLEAFQSKQKMYFLDALIAASPLKHELINKIDSTYKLSSSPNVEIVFRYLMMCLKSRYTAAVPVVTQFLAKYGRGLYVRPLFKALFEVDAQKAQEVWHSNRNFWHAIIIAATESIIKSKHTAPN